MQKIKLWFGVCRPYSLFVSASPVIAGLLAFGQVLDIPTAVVTLLCAMSLQVFSNLVNDYYDFVRGCDKAGRSGPQRPLAEGIVNEKQMRTACIIALTVALLLGAYLVWVGGWVILLVGVLSALFAWLYTATRFSLAYLGIERLEEMVGGNLGICKGCFTGKYPIDPPTGDIRGEFEQ